MNETARVQIVTVTIAYCWALDERYWEGLTDVFTADATAYLGQRCDGLDAIVARVREALEPLTISQHMVANHVVDIAGDEARSRCYFRAQHAREIGGELRHLEVGGHYADDLVDTTDGWRICQRNLIALWSTGDPAVLG